MDGWMEGTGKMRRCRQGEERENRLISTVHRNILNTVLQWLCKLIGSPGEACMHSYLFPIVRWIPSRDNRSKQRVAHAHLSPAVLVGSNETAGSCSTARDCRWRETRRSFLRMATCWRWCCSLRAKMCSTETAGKRERGGGRGRGARREHGRMTRQRHNALHAPDLLGY